MEKCKYCGQELPDEQTLCPNCGADNAVTAEEPQEQAEAAGTVEPVEAAEPAQPAEPVEEPAQADAPAAKKATPGRIALAVGAVVVLLAVLAALIVAGVRSGKTEEPADTTPGTQAVEETIPATIPADGNPDDITCKGSYTVTDEEVPGTRDQIVAAIGEETLTNAQLQIHYWSTVSSFLNSQQGYYIMMSGGLDYTKPLDTQICPLGQGITWQQSFLEQALNNWRTSCALGAEAEKAGIQMTQEEKDFLEGLEEYLTTVAGGYGMTVEDMIHRNVGPGITFEDFALFQERYARGNGYYNEQVGQLVPTQEDLKAFYDAHAEEYAQGGLKEEDQFAAVRHILVAVQGGETDEEGKTVYSDEDWAACEAAAQEILDKWLAGEADEDAFAALANEVSEDPGSNTTGGLYENIVLGQMMKPFEDWCFDESRAYGDYGLVKTDYGYHIMFFVERTPQWSYYAGQDWLIEQVNLFIDNLVEGYPMEVDYTKIALGNVDLGQ